MAHIVIDARFYRQSTAGLGRYSRELIDELAKLDQLNRYTILLTPADRLEYQLTAKNFEPLVIDIPHYSLAEQLKLPAIIRKLRPDLVHYLNFNHPIFSPRPFMVTIHDLIMLHQPTQTSPLRRLAFLANLQHAAWASRLVITPTKFVAKDVAQSLHLNPDKIKPIYEGAFTPQLSNSAESKGPKTKPYLLAVAQWRPHKGLIELIEAWSAVADELDLDLVLPGKPSANFPELAKQIKNLAQNQPRLRLPGFVSDEQLSQLYSEALAFVFPSHAEGFGLPPLEAMAHHTPVLANRASTMPELLGEAALYFDTNQPTSIQQAVRQIATDTQLRHELVKRGDQQLAKYSWAKMAAETLKLYQEIIKD
ncbi:MAG: Glycosyl transferase, group 1 [Candidatus Berkelbacteria bacterium Gr01-1014_85]|uniref:Glycosyl transferase, group 1 n=1 Tax=Candidatus Berkelbacteria bacterium Gr01-1014_85 TaxID=2017150 RepID=A0A554JE85_9BACT|nr:MAG: Glycosyl transferase, group 1 [Candidatus Berkelbacteria bacterium Gr01-1014_85]